MRIAVVGAGNWGKNLVRTFHGLGALAVVVETSVQLREQVKAEYPDVIVSDGFKEAMACDAVALATPAQTHAEIAKMFLLLGKDVFVEKPMTLSSHEAEELCAIAKDQDAILMAGHLLLYQPAIQWIREQIHGKLIGELVSVHQERLNLGKARAVENVLWSLGVHDVAVALYLLNSAPVKVRVSSQNVLTEGVADDYYVHITSESGAQAHLHCSWLWPTRRRSTTLIGTQGMLVYDELAQTVTLHKKSIGDDLQNLDLGEEIVFEGAGEPLKIELQHFLDCCANRRQPFSNGESALEVIRVLEQAEQGTSDRIVAPC